MLSQKAQKKEIYLIGVNCDLFSYTGREMLVLGKRLEKQVGVRMLEVNIALCC